MKCALVANNHYQARSVYGRSTTRRRNGMLSIAFHGGSGEMERIKWLRLPAVGCVSPSHPPSWGRFSTCPQEWQGENLPHPGGAETNFTKRQGGIAFRQKRTFPHW